MSEPMDAFDRLIAREVVLAVGPPRAVDDGAILAAIAAVRPPRWRLHPMVGATRLAIATSIVALVAGLTLTVSLITQPRDVALPAAGSPSPIASDRPVQLPAIIPDELESGVLETPLGQARWVHLQGDGETLPDLISPIPVPGGFVSLTENGTSFGPCPASQTCEARAALWFTPDLIHWERRTLPVDADHARLTRAGGTYWLTASGEFEGANGRVHAPSLWRSSDTVQWEAIDLGHLEPPAPQAMDWRVRLGTLAASGDTTLVPVIYEGRRSTTLLGLPPHPEGEDRAGEFAGLEPVGDGSYRVLGAYADEHARVRFVATDGGLRVIDDQTGAGLTFIEGIGLDFIERWAGREGSPPEEVRLAVIRDGRVIAAELPAWRPRWDGYALMATGEGFRAFERPSDGLVGTWESADGENWTAGETLGDEAGEPTGIEGVSIGPDGAYTWGGPAWRSANGDDWELVQRAPGEFVVHLGAGWVSLHPGSLVIYPQGRAEQTVLDVRHLGLKPESLGAGGYGLHQVSANTIAWSVYEDEAYQGWRRDHWIITFDDLPAGERPTVGE